MSTGFVDLHTHSTASDGTYPPEDVARLAKQSSLVGFALTDHDTIAGLDAAERTAREIGIAFVPGVEISCQFPHPGTLHLLGYCIDTHSAQLRDVLDRLIEARQVRNPQMVRRLNDLGVAITMAEVEDAAGGEVIGRPHMAAVLVRKGYVNSIKEAFNKYLGQGAPAYVEKERLSSREAIAVVLAAGGLPVLAHPVQLRAENEAQLERVLKDLTDLGLAGIEVIHSDHDAARIEKYTKLADRFGLLKTGGSDFHGINKKEIQLGNANGRRIPRQFMDDLFARKNEPIPVGR
jgi:3',5'-nucleoside bisphosphate phosphatase